MGSGDVKKRTKSATEVEGLTFSRVAAVAPTRQAAPIRLDRIITIGRLRPVEPASVEALKVSISESGLGQPITVRPSHEDADGQWYKLVVGGHRLAAMIGLGWTEIEPSLYRLVELTDAQAALVEIDENLIRRELTPYERAVFIEARLKAWAEVNPARVSGKPANLAQLTPKRGRPANSVKLTEFLGDASPTMGFTAETAQDLDISASTVERALAVARGLSEAVHAKIRGSKITRNESLLRQIAGVADPAEQLKVVEALTDGRAAKFADAMAMANGRTPMTAPPNRTDETLLALKKLWRGSSQTDRDAMLNWLFAQPLPAGWTLTKGDANA